ncbi:cytochrome C oxidase subunit IV family protein [Pseudothauera rhizosphaerae]|uniref:Cytochrome C oxidase subunit IV n=1 Tax=Pseudothauera rhizosphaerae TaxID=2565932 RepID=A0A4S4ADP2_9RHOO|nr:cytochrome C oxidase subunit IV family protein [Pseudothauera rhizosphaerae]THF57212.1 hypothetical protein E6O51_18080 [Pseudothauera rhizosphaerae]
MIRDIRSADRRSTVLWGLLIVATAFTWAVGEGGAGGPVIAALLLGVALLKGAAVILDFMALARAPLLWKLLTLGWLALVCALIGLAYWKGMP